MPQVSLPPGGFWRLAALLLAAGLLPAGHCIGETVVDVPLVRAASHPTQQSFIRISSLGEAGVVALHAYDDQGLYRQSTVEIDADATVGLNSNDLEQGNRGKGFGPGLGTGTGDWTLQLRSEIDFKAGSYLRTADGFLTSMGSALLPLSAAAIGLDGEGCAFEVNIFNPASNHNQRSWLRLINYDFKAASVEVRGIDDAGERRGPVTVSIPPGEVRALTSVQLERGGAGLTGALGDGQGKWRLTLFSASPLTVMNLLETPTGHLTNLGPTAMPGASDAVRPLGDAWCDSAPTFVISRGR